MNESGEICIRVGGMVEGRKEGRKEERQKGNRKGQGALERHTHTHTDVRLVMEGHTEHQVQMPGSYPLVYANKKVF